ncbi:MAG: lytic transglycosylase domain-containing protein [Desulfovibrio sp.]|jgi:hypothetical protein|nr:lytic transglycosylase domain-containing protein [Desulfovibrio sp.]
MKGGIVCAALLLCLLPASGYGRERVAVPGTTPLYLECVLEAAQKHGLPLAALLGILAVEDGKSGEALLNSNGTWDMGRFQINTCHVNELLAVGIRPEAILRDGCVNAHAAAWLLRKEYKRTGNIWDAVGAYHSRTPRLRDAYIAKVRKHLDRLGKEGVAGLFGSGR